MRSWKLPLVAAMAIVACRELRAIEIIAQEYRIFGAWREEVSSYLYYSPEITPTAGGFDVSGNDGTPLTLDVATEPYALGVASATVSSFHLEMNATAAGDGLRLPDGLEAIDNRIIMTAQANTRFRPTSTQLSLTVKVEAAFNYYDSEQGVQVALVDLTTGATLSELAITPSRTAPTIETFNFTVDSSHEYELQLVGNVLSFDSKLVTMSASVSLQSAMGYRTNPDGLGAGSNQPSTQRGIDRLSTPIKRKISHRKSPEEVSAQPFVAIGLPSAKPHESFGDRSVIPR